MIVYIYIDTHTHTQKKENKRQHFMKIIGVKLRQ